MVATLYLLGTPAILGTHPHARPRRLLPAYSSRLVHLQSSPVLSPPDQELCFVSTLWSVAFASPAHGSAGLVLPDPLQREALWLSDRDPLWLAPGASLKTNNKHPGFLKGKMQVQSSKASFLSSAHSFHQMTGEILGLTLQITVIKIHFLNGFPLGPVYLPAPLTAPLVCSAWLCGPPI